MQTRIVVEFTEADLRELVLSAAKRALPENGPGSSQVTFTSSEDGTVSAQVAFTSTKAR
jgi:hypothetical protein